MDEPGNNQTELERPEPKKRKKLSEVIGQNILGVTYIAPDFDEDIPLEYLLGEDLSSESEKLKC